jgi:hypothetical protein
MVSIKMTAGTGGTVPLSIPDKLTGLTAFTAAVVMLRVLPFRVSLAAARILKRILAREPASQQDAEQAVAARDWAARWFPGRVACLENSLAALLFTALHRRNAAWCIGFRLQPAESHAWIQDSNGNPAGEPSLHDRLFHVTVQV